MLTGKNLIACEPADSADGRFTAGGTSTEFEEASVAHVDRAVEAAENAFHSYRRVSADVRAEFLDRIAEAIETSRRSVGGGAMPRRRCLPNAWQASARAPPANCECSRTWFARAHGWTHASIARVPIVSRCRNRTFAAC